MNESRGNFVAHVVERTNRWEVKTINYLSEPGIIKPNRKYIQLNEKLAKVISKHLEEGKVVDIPVGVKKITAKNIVVTDGDELERLKEVGVAKLTSHINELFLKMSFMDLYDFIAINNKFSSMGFFIYEDNKEEIYLKIINTGDEKLIGVLEEHLDRIEVFDTINRKYRILRTSIDEVFKAENSETVISILSDVT